MVDYAQARRMMVDGQVRTADVTDLRIIAAMLAVPRERFAPGREAIAYLDIDLPVPGGAGRALLKPMVFAKLLQAAEIGPDDTVLDIGCATGYSAAVLARLAGRVVALDDDDAAPALLAGIPNVTVVTGALNAGWEQDARYDVIMIEGAAEVVPQALFGQLKDGGRLLAVVGAMPMGKATIYRVCGGHVSAHELFDAAAPALPGFAKPPAFVF
jgi:protein-L-isoaspartate(D-aspartate) O-methyltransferase